MFLEKQLTLRSEQVNCPNCSKTITWAYNLTSKKVMLGSSKPILTETCSNVSRKAIHSDKVELEISCPNCHTQIGTKFIDFAN